MIERSRAEAAARLAALHAAAFEHSWSAEAIADMIANGAVGFSDERGFILIRIVADEVEILTLAVAPEARGQGLGRTLVEAGIKCAANFGAEAMFLEVAADNAAALALYARCGFHEVGVRRGYYARSGSTSVDAIVMRMSLIEAA